MARPRLTKAGAWELAVRHPSLPKGRKYLTFNTEAEALDYAHRWALMKGAQLAPPVELQAASRADPSTLGSVIRAFANSGLAAPSQQIDLGTLISEVGAIKLVGPPLYSDLPSNIPGDVKGIVYFNSIVDSPGLMGKSTL